MSQQSRPPQSFAYLRRSKGKLGNRHDPSYQQREIDLEIKRLTAKAQNPEHARLMPPPFAGAFADSDTSGYKTEIEHRVEGMRMLQTVQPGDWVFVHHVDRLGRQSMDIVHAARVLIKRKVKLWIMGIPDEYEISSIHGEILLFFFALGAKMESERKSQVQKASQAKRRAQGINVNQKPMGYKLRPVAEEQHDGTTKIRNYLELDEDFIRVCETLFRWFEKGWSVRNLVKEATRLNLKTHDGGPWTFHRMWRALEYVRKRNTEAQVSEMIRQHTVQQHSKTTEGQNAAATQAPTKKVVQA